MSSPENTEDVTLMSPELAATIHLVGQHLRSAQITNVTEMTVYGAYFVLITTALWAVGVKPDRTARMFWLLAAMLFTFALVTISVVIDVTGPVKFVETVLIGGTSGTLSLNERFGEYGIWTEANHVTLVFLWINGTADTGLLFIVNDLLASWRAVSIWGINRSSSRLCAIILYCLVFVAFAFWAAFVSLFTYNTEKSSFQTTTEDTDPVTVLLYVSSAASIAANVLATGLIGVSTYEYMRTGARINDGTTRGVRILVLLTESGMLYAVLQIVRLALSASIGSAAAYSPHWVTAIVFSNTTSIITAMYPPALLLIVRYGYSLSDTIFTSTVHSNEIGQWKNKNVEMSAIRFKRETPQDDLSGGGMTSSGGITSSEGMNGGNEPEFYPGSKDRRVSSVRSGEWDAVRGADLKRV